MNECVDAATLLEERERVAEHLRRCPSCRSLADELDEIRGMARALPADGWAGGPPPEVDVEAALAAVLEAHQPHRRRWKGTLLRLTSSAAAALLLASLVLPPLLRLRIEHTSASPNARALAHDPGQPVWWTSPGH